MTESVTTEHQGETTKPELDAGSDASNALPDDLENIDFLLEEIENKIAPLALA
jgi:hypothetical protein